MKSPYRLRSLEDWTYVHMRHQQYWCLCAQVNEYDSKPTYTQDPYVIPPEQATYYIDLYYDIGEQACYAPDHAELW